jgi:hypothetical protein
MTRMDEEDWRAQVEEREAAQLAEIERQRLLEQDIAECQALERQGQLVVYPVDLGPVIKIRHPARRPSLEEQPAAKKAASDDAATSTMDTNIVLRNRFEALQQEEDEDGIAGRDPHES